MLATGTHRLGFTDRFTGEAHGELLEDQQTVGAGGAYLWTGAGVSLAETASAHRAQITAPQPNLQTDRDINGYLVMLFVIDSISSAALMARVLNS